MWHLLIKEFNLMSKLLLQYSKKIVKHLNYGKITGFSDSQILKISTDDNFWSMGELGPWTIKEIFFDNGSGLSGGLPEQKHRMVKDILKFEFGIHGI